MQPVLPARSRLRAFTLVELMVVVVIVGILATVAVVALRRLIQGSHSAEALSMIQSIRAAEERWRSEHLVYLDVSTSGTWYPVDPSTVSGGRRKTTFFGTGSHADDARWKLLSPTVPGPVEFGYQVRAGMPGQAMTAPAITIPSGFAWGTPTEHWYVIQAKGDADRDGTAAFFMASSLKADIFRQNEGE